MIVPRCEGFTKGIYVFGFALILLIFFLFLNFLSYESMISLNFVAPQQIPLRWQNCASLRDALFDTDKVIESSYSFNEWLRIQPFFIDSEHLKYPVGNSKEQEYPFIHQRFNLLGPVINVCKTPLVAYGAGDGEKRACGLSVHEKLMSKCVVYSLGSKNEWDFEEGIFNQTNCHIETFDCTVDPNTLPPKHIRSRVRFHRVCIGESDKNNGTILSWTSILKLVGANVPPTFLKMDIEGAEFPVLRSIIDTGVFLPTQIAVEIHAYTWGNSETRYKSSAELVTFMNYLHRFGGYHLIDRNDNARYSGCTEVLLARATCEEQMAQSKYQLAGLSHLKNQNFPHLANAFHYFFSNYSQV